MKRLIYTLQKKRSIVVLGKYGQAAGKARLVDGIIKKTPETYLSRKRRNKRNSLFQHKSKHWSHLEMALPLIVKAIQYCDEALEELQYERIIDSDSAMLSVKALLPELFCNRSIGEGYTTITNAVMNAFDSMRGDLFALEQIRALRDAFYALQAEPLLNFESALDVVETLENTGLFVEPPAYSMLAEVLLGAE